MNFNKLQLRKFQGDPFRPGNGVLGRILFPVVGFKEKCAFVTGLLNNLPCSWPRFQGKSSHDFDLSRPNSPRDFQAPSHVPTAVTLRWQRAARVIFKYRG